MRLFSGGRRQVPVASVDPGAGDRALERLLEAQRIGLIGDWEYDLADGSISWSTQVFVIMGRDPALGPPRDLDDQRVLHDAASAAVMAEKVALAIASGLPQDYELVVVHPGGRRACPSSGGAD